MTEIVWKMPVCASATASEPTGMGSLALAARGGKPTPRRGTVDTCGYPPVAVTD
jgi:hypothetical protein